MGRRWTAVVGEWSDNTADRSRWNDIGQPKAKTKDSCVIASTYQIEIIADYRATAALPGPTIKNFLISLSLVTRDDV